MSTDLLERDLLREVDGEIRFDAGARGAYSTDASNYRQVPIGVVLPRNVEAGARAIAVCREHDVPVLSRGGGTSLAGQGTNAAVIVDWSKYCNRLVSVDPRRSTCVVEPGIALDDLNRQLAEHGLKFGPKPATHSHCTIGGMIGNNSCGASAQRYGKTADNVSRLEILTYDGRRAWVGRSSTADDELGDLRAKLRDIRDRYAEEIRERFPDIPRRISGYNLDRLLGEELDLAGLVVGSEGTLATVLRAEIDLVPVVPATAMLALGYPDVTAAADAVPDIVGHSSPMQVEAIDGELVHFMKEEGQFLDSVATLPEGESWLLVQFGADTGEEADHQLRSLLRALGKSASDEDVAVSEEPDRQQQMLKAREAGLGVTAHPPDMPASWEGWEDSAVPPHRLGDYLRDLLSLFADHGYEKPALYGHFGHGCVHIRMPFRLKSGPGVRDFRQFLHSAAELVTSYGGSLSGEHGDGQARGELLRCMFGSAIVSAFEEVKAAFDPRDRMNPGKIVHPYRTDENLRLGADYHPSAPATFLGFPDDGGSFSQAASRCVGIGNCRRSTGGVMCPSYMVTREEEHSTRGRARLLFEMLQGHPDAPVRNGWRSTAVRDALDLCLACKGCKSDCPVGVDMATYKAEFLAHHYRHRLRPAAHYSLGWLPIVSRLAQSAPRLVNSALRAPVLAQTAKRLGGIAPERTPPRFADVSFQRLCRRRAAPRPGEPGAVVLWPDTFTNHFAPHIGRAAVDVLEDAGLRVAVPPQPLCCGLTWMSTGQLGMAKRVLRRTLRVLRPWLEAGTPIVGLEPSCDAVFRSDSRELLPHDEDAQRLREQFVTFAEALRDHAAPGWQPPRVDKRAVVQEHCHQHAVLGYGADVELMRRAGVDVDVLDSGCCGLAGNFGFERGHYDVSVACAERVLLPALREADPSTAVVADGFSCRTQIEHGLPSRRPVHLAELLRSGMR
ncbi:FAD/FMN-containing dehydrogenase [Saccharopolyspora kobensis]|uniref:FAD/FMN-containing dehydrogenase n=1 Tax=Saccharopolyspora kobensis TaxID=146035 RepID=A0A1H6AGX7_9PSEU|nr:FAD-binding and (Fe-S)-binding domain-containing protein [Saccharopolyspora kobensis]SEG47958.1 FAD/FMN-containing dehydrogenase [Saccharopolyspora kobensis]SFE57128.1 FAD/FMN-containing dehydrogenase [Saccharopolyspora kobensis]